MMDIYERDNKVSPAIEVTDNLCPQCHGELEPVLNSESVGDVSQDILVGYICNDCQHVDQIDPFELDEIEIPF